MNQLIDNWLTTMNSIGGEFWSYAAGMFVQSGVLILSLLTINFLLRKRVRATFRYWLWMLVFIKLILPPSLSLPTGVGYWLGDHLTADSVVLEVPLNTALPEPAAAPVSENRTISAEIPFAQQSETNRQPITSTAPTVSTLPPITWRAIVFLLWLAGVSVISILVIRRISFVRRVITQSAAAKDQLLDVLNQCRRELDVRQDIQLRLSTGMPSPAVCGLFRPTILMPAALPDKLSPDKLRAVLIHELAHIKRGDLWINSAQTFLQIIYFYNPLVWLANAVVRRTREQAVDEMVLVVLGAGAKDYSNTLIDIAEMAFFRTSLSLRLIGVVESKKALRRRIRHMLNRPIPANAKLGILGLIAVVVTGAVLLPMANAQKTTLDNTSAVSDSDKDGLENRLEEELGTSSKSSDTDGDGLSDYDEYCKYRTDPTKKDSDGDSKPDGDWQERREYTYTIQAICEIRSPSSMEMINDLYQDARPVEKKATLEDARVVEVLIFPFATAHVYAQPYPVKTLDKRLKEYLKPTASMNFSSEMREEIGDIVKDTATDIAAIEKLLHWMNSNTALVRELPHWEYLNIIDSRIVWHKSFGSPAQDEQFLETNFLGDSMFKKKVHGTCSSTAILRGTMFRAAGFPTRLIQTLPLITRYSEDPEPLADKLRMREMANGYTWGPGNGGANHTYNEVFLNNRWVRIDNSVGTGPFVGDKLFVKAWSSADWNNLKEEWNNKRCFRALDVSDALPKYKTESTKIDIAVEDKNFIVKRQPDGLFEATIRIFNKGPIPIPRFGVYFYAGDPDKGGRLLSTQAAGPIMPGGNWGEYNPRLKLKSGEAAISVVVDPGNRVEESDEKNNKVSRTISTTVKVKPAEGTESSKVDIAIEDKNLTVKKQADGSFMAQIEIHNLGSAPSPEFGVYFYAGDPDKGGRLLAQHAAGPIMPRGNWGEYNPRLKLKPGENTISVVVDPGNKVDESDETNNNASKTISTSLRKDDVKPSREPSDSGSKPNIFIMSPSSFGMFREISDMVKDVTWNKTGRYHDKKSYDEIFIDEIHNKKPGDIIVLLFSLDSPDRIPSEYENLLPKPWPEIEVALKQGKTVELKGESRELNVIFLAAPTSVQLRSLVQESKLLNPSTKPSESNVQTSGSSATLPNGVTVELLGVCEHPSEGRQWWRPNGSLMDKAPYKTTGSRLKRHEGYRDYEFVLRLTGSSGTSYKWEVPGGRQGSDTGAPIGKDGKHVSDLRVYTSNQRQDKKTASVRVGLAAENWDTLATHIPNDREETYSLAEGAVAFGVPYEKDGRTLLPVVHNFNRGNHTVAIRVIAITNSDEQFGSSCSGSGGNVLSSLTYGFGLPLDNIREFRFETRPYTWVEFKNVSLQPGHKTNVQF
ncbi:M56 family metallopeptidase [Planctomycetota bacterium]